MRIAILALALSIAGCSGNGFAPSPVPSSTPLPGLPPIFQVPVPNATPSDVVDTVELQPITGPSGSYTYVVVPK